MPESTILDDERRGLRCAVAQEQDVVDENGNEIAVILPSGNTDTWKKTFMLSRGLPNGGTKLRSALPGLKNA